MGSASGTKTEVFNPRERALSSDLNRMQAFGGADLAQALAYFFDAHGGGEVANSSGFTSISSSTTSPLRAQILGGLMAVPFVGSNVVQVQPGVLICCDPDAVPSVDDSAYKLVNDPGVQNSSLTMPANASGSTMIYVVECQRADAVLETDSRDVFNPSTGLFAPATVNKVVASRLTYRVRTMTLAGGVVTVLGWLPLMVALVPNGAANWDACPYIWDVRPLVLDRESTLGAATTTTISRLTSSFASFDKTTNLLRGHVEAVSPTGRKIGGDFAYSPADASFDLTSTELRPTGFALFANAPYYLFLCEPFGLPRWCRYTSVASGLRVPGRLRGMPVLFSAGQAMPVTNLNNAAIPSPTAFGFPGNVAEIGTAVGVWAGMATNAATLVQQGYGHDGFFEACYEAAHFVVATASDQNVATWSLASGSNWPSNATAVRLKINVAFGGNAGSSAQVPFDVTVSDIGGTATNSVLIGFTTAISGTQYKMQCEVWFPLDAHYPAGGLTGLNLTVTYFGGTVLGYGVAPASATVQVTGWRLGR